MTDKVSPKLSGRQKAAILLITLGTKMSGNVLKNLSEKEVERLALEIFNTSRVNEKAREEVLQECYQSVMTRNFSASGGEEYAKDVLAEALGHRGAEEIMDRVTSHSRPQAFGFIKDMDPQQVASFIQEERPQTIALILSHLKPNGTAQIFSQLSPELQTEVAMRIATMDDVPPQVVESVEKVLRQKLSSVTAQQYASSGGTRFLAKVLSNVDRGTEKTILTRLEEANPELAGEVRKLMFVFEDLIQLDDKSLQIVLQNVDYRDLAIALKGVSEVLKQRIFANLSTRAEEMLKEELELAGPVRLRHVEETQQRIVNVARQLEEADKITIARGADDVLI